MCPLLGMGLVGDGVLLVVGEASFLVGFEGGCGGCWCLYLLFLAGFCPIGCCGSELGSLVVSYFSVSMSCASGEIPDNFCVTSLVWYGFFGCEVSGWRWGSDLRF